MGSCVCRIECSLSVPVPSGRLVVAASGCRLATRCHLSRQRGSLRKHSMPADDHRRGCARLDHPDIGRRRLVQASGLSLLGVWLADLLRLEANAAATRPVRGTAKSVVFIFQSGGPSQHETWDPKPDAPAEIRGEYGTTATRTAGFHILRIPAQALGREPTASRSCARCTTRRRRRFATSTARRCIWCKPVVASCRQAKRRSPSPCRSRAAWSGRRSDRRSPTHCPTARRSACRQWSSCHAPTSKCPAADPACWAMRYGAVAR